MLFTSVVACATRTYLRMKDILQLCTNFLWCVPSRWIVNVWFPLAVTASQWCNVLFDPYLFEAQPHYAVFVFLSFARVPNSSQSLPVYLLRLVTGPDREFSCRICEKCRKFLHKTLKETCLNVRKWSKVNVPLFLNIPQQFPCSLKVFSKYPLFPKSKWLCSSVP